LVISLEIGFFLDDMENLITITMAATKANRMLIADLVGVSGVSITCGPVVEETAIPEEAEMTIGEMARRLGLNYYTARDWVVVKKRIPHHRPSGKTRGSILVNRAHVEQLANGPSKEVTNSKVKKRRGGVAII
jgi:excisionase family DNA binding protein